MSSTINFEHVFAVWVTQGKRRKEEKIAVNLICSKTRDAFNSPHIAENNVK